MLRLKQATLLAAGLSVLAGCAAKAPDTAAVEAMIRAHTAAWVEAYNAGDADKIVAGYTDDAVLMPPDAPAATGHEAMKQFLVGDMASAKAAGSTLTLDSDTVGVSGDLAWHSGTFHVNGSAGSPVGSGKYLEVWKKGAKDNNWLMIRDIWNNDAAAAAMAPPPAPEPKAATAKPAPKKKHKKK